MPTLKGVTVQVCSNGQALTEYDPASEEAVDASDAELTRYIESQPGSKFLVRIIPDYSWSHPSGSLRGAGGLRVAVTLDGDINSIMVGKYAPSSDIKSVVTWEKGFKHRRDFEFAEIKTSEENPSNPTTISALAASARKIGTIEVKLQRVRGWTDSDKQSGDCTGNLTGTIPEKALKGSAASHRSAYSISLTSYDIDGLKEQRLGQRHLSDDQLPSVNCDAMDPIHNPWAVFKFRYRSRKALQIEGVIPRDPSPALEARPPPNEPLAEYSSDELRRILRKREYDTTLRPKPEIRYTPSVKRELDPDIEVVSENQRQKRGGAREVIELLDD